MVLKGKAPVDSECKAKLRKVQDFIYCTSLKDFKILIKVIKILCKLGFILKAVLSHKEF